MLPQPMLMSGSRTDHLQAALDASCAALIALERAQDELDDADPELVSSRLAEADAIEHVRIAIRELRRQTVRGPLNPLALGFVAPPETGTA
jgi:hypothetical protein